MYTRLQDTAFIDLPDTAALALCIVCIHLYIYMYTLLADAIHMCGPNGLYIAVYICIYTYAPRKCTRKSFDSFVSTNLMYISCKYTHLHTNMHVAQYIFVALCIHRKLMCIHRKISYIHSRRRSNFKNLDLEISRFAREVF